MKNSTQQHGSAREIRSKIGRVVLEKSLKSLENVPSPEATASRGTSTAAGAFGALAAQEGTRRWGRSQAQALSAMSGVAAETEKRKDFLDIHENE